MTRTALALSALIAVLGVSPALAQTAARSGQAAAGTTDGDSLAGYRLVWADEFETDGPPDPTKWAYDTHANAGGWYNNELQYYAADRPENARVEDGKLIIEARRERLESAADFGGQDYTSARLVTEGRASWTYGFFEVRAKIPCGKGTWPAIWMLSDGADAWPEDGEIDIMEHVGHDKGVVHGTVHTGAYNHVENTHKGGQTRVRDACDAFHNYQVLWTPETIRFGVDGRGYQEFPNDGRGDPETWPFDKPFHLILNIAVGGDWGGAEGVSQRSFPARMEVDHVRVFQREG